MYAFRDNAAGTAQAMYKSSGAGWDEVELLDEIEFDTGDMSAPDSPRCPWMRAELEQGGNTATIKRVVAEKWGVARAAQARGEIHHYGPPGESLFRQGRQMITNDGLTNRQRHGDVGWRAHAAIMLLAPGGHWQWIEHNFQGIRSKPFGPTGADGKNRIHGLRRRHPCADSLCPD